MEGSLYSNGLESNGPRSQHDFPTYGHKRSSKTERSDLKMIEGEMANAAGMTEPPFKKQRGSHHCPVCDSYFTERRALLRHCRENKRHAELTNTVGDMQTRCDQCDRSFTRTYDLQRHQSEVHEAQRRKRPQVTIEIKEQQAEARDLTEQVQPAAREVNACMEEQSLSTSCTMQPLSADDSSSTEHDTVLGPSLALSTTSSPSEEVDLSWEEMEGILREAFDDLYLNDSVDTKLLTGANWGQHNAKLQQCPRCLQHFSDANKLLQCMTNHAENPTREHQCRDCDFGFVTAEHLCKHLESSNGERAHCGFRFNHDCMTGHHRPDSLLHQRMDLWYIGQLALKADKRATVLARKQRNFHQQRPWSLCAMEDNMSHLSLATSLNSRWTAPSLHGRNAIGGRTLTELKSLARGDHSIIRMHSAILANDANTVRDLIRQGVDVNGRTRRLGRHIPPSGSSMLTVALNQNARPYIITLLLEAGALSDIPACDRAIIKLYAAVIEGHIRTVRELIDAGVDVNGSAEISGCQIPPLGLSMLRIALNHNAGAYVITLLLEAGASSEEISASDRSIIELYVAVKKGNIHAVRNLIDAGADVNGRAEVFGCHLPPSGISIIAVAAEQDADSNIATLLLEAGARPEETLISTYNLAIFKLHAAIVEGNEHVVRELIQAGVDVNGRARIFGRQIPSADSSILTTALRRCNLDQPSSIIEALLKAGATVPNGSVSDCDRDTVRLYTAILKGDEDVVRHMLQTNVDINSRAVISGHHFPPVGSSMLTIAVGQSNSTIIEALLDAGVTKPHGALSDYDKDAVRLYCAVLKGDHDAVEQMLWRQVDVNSQTVKCGNHFPPLNSSMLSVALDSSADMKPIIAALPFDAGADTNFSEVYALTQSLAGETESICNGACPLSIRSGLAWFCGMVVLAHLKC